MSQNTDPWIGRRVGRYILRQKLGSGGSGAVYAAWDEVLEREVALKLLLMLPGATTEMIERFQQEAKLTGRLSHPNIVPIYDIGEDAGVLYIAMRRLSGATLGDQLTAQGTLSQSEAIHITIPLAEALAYAHQRNIVHRDIKPANVLFDDGSRPMLVDFGIAKALDMRGKGLTLTGTTIGTPPYMSPEQASGESLDHRSDIYSLGILLYHMVTSRPPFQGNAPTVMQAHLFQTPAPPRTFRPDLNPELEKVILKALAKKPYERFQSATEMARALNAILQGQPTQIHLPPSATQAAPPSRVVDPSSYPPRQPISSQRQSVAPQSARPPTSRESRQPTRQSRRGFPVWSFSILMLVLLCLTGAIVTAGFYLSGVNSGGNSNGGVVFPNPDTPTTIVQEASATPIPPTDTAVPVPDVTQPPAEEPTQLPATDVPPTDVPATDVPPTDVPPTEVPPTEVPPTEVPPTEVPPTQVPPTQVPPTPVPPTQVPPTATEVPPTEVPPTEVPPTATEVPPTATEVPPTATEVPPTATEVPPTATEVPPTATEVPPTATELPPTATEVPPTATELPPTATEVAAEPTNTSIPPILGCPIPPADAFSGFFNPDSMGCPEEEAVQLTGTYQQFERGLMIYDGRKDPGFIYVFDQSTSSWDAYPNRSEEGDPEFFCPEAAGAEGPTGEIGRIWCEKPSIQATIGNVTASALSSQMVFQPAENALLIYVAELPARIALFFENQGL